MLASTAGSVRAPLRALTATSGATAALLGRPEGTFLRPAARSPACGGEGRLSLPRRTYATQRDETGKTGGSSPLPSASTTPKPRVSVSGTTVSAGARPPRVQTVFVILCSLGLLATAYGVYEYSQSFQTWPRELREDLRAALHARNRGDVKHAKVAFAKVLAAARRMVPAPSQEGAEGSGPLGSKATLKTTGIAIAYAAMLEREGELLEAYKVYSDALDEILLRGSFDPSLASDEKEGQGQSQGAGAGAGEPGTQSVRERAQARARYERVRSPEERMRAVAIAQRLGDLALRAEVRDALVNAGAWGAEPAEEHLQWSVEELLRLVVPASGSAAKMAAAGGQGKDADGTAWLTELELPKWVTRTDVGASLEALGAFYASRNNIEYAVPLFLQALALLLPPSSPLSASAGGPVPEQTLASKLAAGGDRRAPPTTAERCHAGVLMNNLAQLFVQVPESSPLRRAGLDSPTSSASDSVGPLGQGLAWASRGLDVVQTAQAGCGWVNSARDGVGVSLVSTGDTELDLVRAECARAQVTLLYNLGQISEMAKDLPSARRYFQRAYTEAERYGFRDARSRSAQGLSRLERARKA
ncbi:hypothetical protein OC844_000800 [Tilletia horrida]|nr:hypothetical protein OC844_000800 [Tilletia horrida]